MNKKNGIKSFLHRIRKNEDTLCSYCKLNQKTKLFSHVFDQCDNIRKFCNHYKHGWFILNGKKYVLYQGKGKLGNNLLAVAKHYTYKNIING